MKRTLLVLSTLLSFASIGQDCSDLFISEYVEGWSNNKALEIYNPTDSPIDLSQYIVVRYSNGATTATAANAVQLTGTVGAHDVYVAVLEKLDPNGTQQEAPIWDSLQARADGYYCPDYNVSNAFYWNGNDAITLAKGVTTDIQNASLVDVFGKIGDNPGNGSDPETGWTSAFPYNGPGDGLTVDHSLIRKASVKQGVVDPNISYFIALDEYDSIPAVVDIAGTLYGNWFTLGSHTCDCGPLGVETVVKEQVSIFPNPSNGEFFVNNSQDFVTISIVNSLGQSVMSVTNNSKALLSFDLGKRRGVYFVKLTDNAGNTTTKRVIVK